MILWSLELVIVCINILHRNPDVSLSSTVHIESHKWLGQLHDSVLGVPGPAKVALGPEFLLPGLNWP